eukprot:scaffold7390_cov420-Prasinococcus_capsulatus_cf.AAC.2
MAVVLGRQMDNSLFETIEAADEADQKLLSEGLASHLGVSRPFTISFMNRKEASNTVTLFGPQVPRWLKCPASTKYLCTGIPTCNERKRLAVRACSIRPGEQNSTQRGSGSGKRVHTCLQRSTIARAWAMGTTSSCTPCHTSNGGPPIWTRFS